MNLKLRKQFFLKIELEYAPLGRAVRQ